METRFTKFEKWWENGSAEAGLMYSALTGLVILVLMCFCPTTSIDAAIHGAEFYAYGVVLALTTFNLFYFGGKIVLRLMQKCQDVHP